MKPAHHHYRSALTGRWVSAAYAERYPHLTIRERVTSPGFDAFCKGYPEKPNKLPRADHA